MYKSGIGKNAFLSHATGLMRKLYTWLSNNHSVQLLRTPHSLLINQSLYIPMFCGFPLIITRCHS